MRTDPRAVDPQLEWNEQTKSVALEIDQDRARAFGLTRRRFRKPCRHYCLARTVAEYREWYRKHRCDGACRARRAPRSHRISDLTILARNGQAIPLSQWSTIRYGFEEPILWRRNASSICRSVRCGSRRATSDGDGCSIAKIAELSARLPSGYRIDTAARLKKAKRRTRPSSRSSPPCSRRC